MFERAISEVVAEWCDAGEPVSDKERETAIDIAQQIYNDIEVFRDEIDYDADDDYYTIRDYAFDLMTVLCFDRESSDSIQWSRDFVTKISGTDKKEICEAYGIPESVLACIIEFNNRRFSFHDICSENRGMSLDEANRRIWKATPYPFYDPSLNYGEW